MGDESIAEMLEGMREEEEQVRRDKENLEEWANGESDVYGEDGMRRETRRASAMGRRKAHTGQHGSVAGRSDQYNHKYWVNFEQRQERRKVKDALRDFEERMPRGFYGKKKDSSAIYEGNVRRWKEKEPKSDIVGTVRTETASFAGRGSGEPKTPSVSMDPWQRASRRSPKGIF